MIRKFYLVAIFFIILPSLALTQGRIRGKIIDRETGQPLPGANVKGVDTQFWVSVSISGDYAVAGVFLDDDRDNSSGTAYLFDGLIRTIRL